MIGLDSEHHADEGSRDRHHRDALDADGVENRHQHRPPRPTAKDPDQSEDRELADVADLGDRVEHLLPQPMDRRGRGRIEIHLRASLGNGHPATTPTSLPPAGGKSPDGHGRVGSDETQPSGPGNSSPTSRPRSFLAFPGKLASPTWKIE